MGDRTGGLHMTQKFGFFVVYLFLLFSYSFFFFFFFFWEGGGLYQGRSGTHRAIKRGGSL